MFRFYRYFPKLKILSHNKKYIHIIRRFFSSDETSLNEDPFYFTCCPCYSKNFSQPLSQPFPPRRIGRKSIQKLFSVDWMNTFWKISINVEFRYHKLFHQDTRIRLIAKEIYLKYIRWAAGGQSNNKEKVRIRTLLTISTYFYFHKTNLFSLFANHHNTEHTGHSMPPIIRCGVPWYSPWLSPAGGASQ